MLSTILIQKSRAMIASLITGIVLGKIISSSYSEFKNDTTSVEDLLNGGGGVVSPKACNAVNIVAFANNVNNDTYIIPFLMDTDDWFCQNDTQKLCIRVDGNKTYVDVVLPNYTGREFKCKIPDFVRAVKSWARSTNFRFKLNTALRIAYADKNGDGYFYDVPEETTKVFADERDPSGANRMYEAYVLSKNELHEDAINYLKEEIPEDSELKLANVVITVEFSDINNEELYEILSHELNVLSRDESVELKTENILFLMDDYCRVIDTDTDDASKIAFYPFEL